MASSVKDLSTASKALRSGRQRVLMGGLEVLKPTSDGPLYKWDRPFTNRETGKLYDYHHGCSPEKPGDPPCFGTDETCSNVRHMAEKLLLYSDGPSKYILVKGGEGSGKSVFGIMKDLMRLQRGMSGIMVSPDFEHFKKSLWAEFRRWCPPEAVLARERYRLKPDWEPSKQFELHFHTIYGGQPATLYCGGMDDPSGWHGPNVSWAHGDEVHRKNDSEILTVLSGRVRIDGPKGEKPQLWFTTTPKMNWLFDFFGGVPNPFGDMMDDEELFKDDDVWAAFKRKAVLLTIRTRDNQANLTEDYVEDRAAPLTESQRAVYLDAAWHDIAELTDFLPDGVWDACKEEELPPLGKHEPVVMAVDGAYAAKGDSFARVLAGPHPSRQDVAAIRKVVVYEAKGVQQDFESIMDDIKCDCLDHAVQEIFYDPRELHHMMTLLRVPSKTKDGRKFPGVTCTEFPQGVPREEADKALHDRAITRRVAHDGHPKLREHVHNANKKTTDEGKHVRIVKKHAARKIDAAVCASMACFKADEIVIYSAPQTSSSSGPFR